MGEHRRCSGRKVGEQRKIQNSIKTTTTTTTFTEKKRNEDVGSCQIVFEKPPKQRLEEGCISYISVVVKHHDQKQFKEEFILAYGSEVQNSRTVQHQKQKQRDHISTTHGKDRIRTENRVRLKIPYFSPSARLHTPGSTHPTQHQLQGTKFSNI